MNEIIYLHLNVPPKLRENKIKERRHFDRRRRPLNNSFSKQIMSSDIHLFRERLSEKSIKVHMTRPKGGLGIHWNFAYWPRGLYICTWRICFSSQEAFICSFTFTVACLWVRKIPLNFRGAKRTLFLHVWKERKTWNSRLICCYTH